MDRMSTNIVKTRTQRAKSPSWRVKCQSDLQHFLRNYYKCSPRRFIDWSDYGS
jgi:hypothetical protein